MSDLITLGVINKTGAPPFDATTTLPPERDNIEVGGDIYSRAR
jgi:hypothetical protein